MKDTFDFRNWITENNVGPYSKMNSNKKLIKENIEEETIGGNISATVDAIDPDYIQNLAYGTNVRVTPSGDPNFPNAVVITGPQNVVTNLLSDLGYEEGTYELSEDIQETPTEDTMEEAQSEMEFYDRAWGLVGSQLKDIIDTLHNDGFEDEDIMDIMRTSIEQYDQVFIG